MRSHTKGYTGPKADEQREYFVYIEEIVLQAHANVEDLIKTNLDSLKPWDFTQFVRGELFVLIDSLLTTSFSQKKVANVKVPLNEMNLILNLCEGYVVLYCKWLQKLSIFQSAVLIF